MSNEGPFRWVCTQKWAFALLAVSVCFPVLSAEAGRPVRSLAEIRHDRVVMQKWDMSCGAAALATLLTYDHNDPVPEREVATAMLRRTQPLKVRAQGGFSLLDLQEYAQGRGYEADGYGELSFSDLRDMAPAIVPIQVHGYDHFVVFRGVRGDDVLFADPAYGNRTLPLPEFENSWVQKVAFVVTRPTP
ncbi:C39 family peptidase [Azospirillum soli]|uniref:C39 family peptidase n=1 Tax=Azospirillum soli TaxID=1304799 RepID=UPI001AE9FDB3|nr:C39 family peptidase [Azospirillum soli]MBP2315624.1 putative double-glycine peptidase [Azospirillum soli]